MPSVEVATAAVSLGMSSRRACGNATPSAIMVGSVSSRATTASNASFTLPMPWFNASLVSSSRITSSRAVSVVWQSTSSGVKNDESSTLCAAFLMGAA
jgi:hypothetical protein